MVSLTDFLKKNKEEKTKDADSAREPLGLSEEKERDIGHIKAVTAGIASGLIKVPEGVFSLGASLIDLGLDTNTAAEVEEFFDKINVYEDVAQKRLSGKLVETMAQIGIPGGIAMKGGLKLANKAIKNKIAGKNFDLKKVSPFQQKMGLTPELKRKLGESGTKLGYATGGAGVGESLVADTGELGYFGESVEDKEGRARAITELANRGKFGLEGMAWAGTLGGLGASAGIIRNREVKLGIQKGKLERALDNVTMGLRSRGFAPTKTAWDAERTMKLSKRVDSTAITNAANSLDKVFQKISFAAKDIPGGKELTEKEFLDHLGDVFTDGMERTPLRRVRGKKPKASAPHKTVLNENTGAVKQLKQDFKTLGLKQSQIKDINLALTDGRNIVDDLSTALLNVKSVTRADKRRLIGGLGKTIKQNLGAYSERSYRVFENKKLGLIGRTFNTWKPTEEVIKKAKTYLLDVSNQKKLHEAGLGFTGPGGKFKPLKAGKAMTQADVNREVDQLVQDLYVQGGSFGAKHGKFKVLAIDNRILDKRKLDKFPEIRELLGEIKDPRFNMINTATKLSNMVHTAGYFNKIYKDGLKNNYIKRARVASEYDDAMRLGYEKIELPKGKTGLSNPLDGQYAPKWLKKSLEKSHLVQNIDKPWFHGAYDNFLLFPKLASQMAKTVFSLTTHVRNFVSAGAFAAANGNFVNPQNYDKALKTAFGPAWAEIFKGRTISKEGLKRYQRLQRLGVINTNVQASELKEAFSQMDKKTLAGENPYALYSALKPFSKIKAGLEKLYYAEDDFWKVVSYQGEVDKLVKANRANSKALKMSMSQIEEEAARIVKNTVPNYDFVPPAIKALRRWPVGNFIAFPTEMIRTSGNILEQALKEMNSTNPYLRSVGEQRLASFALTVGALPVGVQSTFKTLHGTSDEEMMALRETRPDYQKDNVLLPMGRSKNGHFQFMDLSYSLAYDIIAKPAQILFNEYARGNRDNASLSAILANSLTSSAGTLLKPYTSESIFTEALKDTYDATFGGGEGMTNEGKQVFNPFDPAGDKIMKTIKHGLLDPITPGSTAQFKRAILAGGGIRDVYGQKYDLGNEALGLTGFRIMEVDPNVSAPFITSKFNKEKDQARKIFSGDLFKLGLLKLGKFDANDMVDQYKKSERARFEIFQDAHRKVKALETLGTSRGLISRKLKNVSKKEKDSLLNGRYLPYKPGRSLTKTFDEKAREYRIPNPWPSARNVIFGIHNSNIGKPLDGPNPYNEYEIDRNTGEVKMPSISKVGKDRSLTDFLRDKLPQRQIPQRQINQNIQPPTPQQQPQIPDQGAGAGPTPPPPNAQGSISQNPVMYKALYPNDPLAQAIVEGRAGPRGYKRGGLVKK